MTATEPTTEPALPAVRERTHRWEDPMLTAAAALDVDGLTFLHRMASGEVPAPPIALTLGFTVELVEEGRVVFGMEPAEFHFNPIGSVHGGVFATLLDSAAGCAVHSALPAGARYTSLDLSVKFLRPLGAGLGPGSVRGAGGAPGRPDGARRGPAVRWPGSSVRPRDELVPGDPPQPLSCPGSCSHTRPQPGDAAAAAGQLRQAAAGTAVAAERAGVAVGVRAVITVAVRAAPAAARNTTV